MPQILTAVAAVIVSSFVTVECGRDEERLIDHIFNVRRYNQYARPVERETDALEVTFGISLQQIIDVDEKNEMLHTNLWLNYEWEDYNLKWNESEYGGLRSIRLPSKMIWTPDILLYNSADEDIDSKFPTNVVVTSDGTCNWVPLGLYISSCSIDIRWFPFDDQFCKLKFGSWTYDGNSINLTSRKDTVDISNYQPSGEWQLLDVPAVRNVVKYDCCPEQYIDITFTLHIRRLTLYYGFNLIIPCALTSLLALVTFLQPPDAGEKIGLGITILLSLSVFQLIVAGMVPATSLAVPIVGIYFAAVMIMCTISVIITVLVLNFHHRKPDMYEMSPQIRKIFCEWLPRLLQMSRPGGVTRDQLPRATRQCPAATHRPTTANSRNTSTLAATVATATHLRRLHERTKSAPSKSLLANITDSNDVIKVHHSICELSAQGNGRENNGHLTTAYPSSGTAVATATLFKCNCALVDYPTPPAKIQLHPDNVKCKLRHSHVHKQQADPVMRLINGMEDGGSEQNFEQTLMGNGRPLTQYPAKISLPNGKKGENVTGSFDNNVTEMKLSAILEELRYITSKLHENASVNEETSDWKFAAMVIDRLSFWVLTVYLVIATLAILVTATFV